MLEGQELFEEAGRHLRRKMSNLVLLIRLLIAELLLEVRGLLLNAI